MTRPHATRRRTLRALFAAPALTLAFAAQAQTAAPALRLVVPFGPGTTLELGVEQRAVPAAELAAFGQQEIGRWAEAVKRSGAQVD